MGKQDFWSYEGYPLLMTAAQMSQVSGIGENTLRKLMSEGRIEYLSIGNRRLLAISSIENFYNQNKSPAVKNNRASKISFK